MKKDNLIKLIFVTIIFCFFSLNSNAFPKKKHSIIKDKIDREKYENVFESGYYYGFMQYCNFNQSTDKQFHKSVKGFIAYTNWSLFLEFNLGVQQIQNELQVAGIGWAGTGSFQEKKIDWKYDLTGCDTKSMSKVYTNMEDVIDKIVLNFLLERDNYQSNLDQLILALEKDKKDDYSSSIKKLKIVSDPNYINETNSTNEEKNTDEDSSTSSSDDIRSQLKKLKSFFEEGLISEDDYANKKKELLDKL